MPRMRVWPSRMLLGLALSAAVAFVVLGVRSTRDERPPLLPGTQAGGLVETRGFSLPGEALGQDAQLLRAPGRVGDRSGHRYTLLGWWYRTVRPSGTRVAYRVRRLDGTDTCPSRHLNYDDAARARRDGERYPCRMERVGGQTLPRAKGEYLVLTAAFRAGPKGGDVTTVGDPEAVVRDEQGRLFRVLDGTRTASCAVGVRACARWAREPDDDPGEPTDAAGVRESLRLPNAVCRWPIVPPLFAAPADRPPRPARVQRGRDTRGRRCAAVTE